MVKRILYHAINSIGVGHLSRTIGIAEGIRVVDPDVSQLFLTEIKETKFLKLHKFPYFPITSLHAILKDQEWQHIDVGRTIWSDVTEKVVADYLPEMVIYDTATWPELINAVRSLQSKPQEIFVLRARKNIQDFFNQNEEVFKAIDLVVFPHDEDEVDFSQIPSYLDGKTYISGNIIRRDISDIDLDFINTKGTD